MEDLDLRKVDEYLDSVKNYRPGVIEDNVYTSEHFGISIEAKDGWKLNSEEEMKAMSVEFEKSVMSSIDEQNLSDKELKKYEDSLSVDAKFSAYYESNYAYAQFIVFSCKMYGAEEYNKDNSDSRTEMIAGKRFFKESGAEMPNGVLVNTSVYSLEKDGVLLLMLCSYVGNGSNEIVEDFINECITAR